MSNMSLSVSAESPRIPHPAEIIDRLPRVERSPDPADDFLLALFEPGKADHLVTGDKSGLLSLARHEGTRIVSAGEFAALRSSGY